MAEAVSRRSAPTHLEAQTASFRLWRLLAALVVFLCATCGVASCACASSPASEVHSPLVSINAASQDARLVISQLASAAGVNIVIDDAINAKITVCLVNVPFEHARDDSQGVGRPGNG
ncbi:MAG: hypothetical protein VB144_15060 [Clostridia bacterium]|nr:hypothetical protein [Clostridia bacterium]